MFSILDLFDLDIVFSPLALKRSYELVMLDSFQADLSQDEILTVFSYIFLQKKKANTCCINFFLVIVCHLFEKQPLQYLALD
ncbi:hypothetical protein Hs20B_16990 [Lactococcus insecticola]|uniref:Uncharacterized protein n=1 Tax=Pseudolactococcus insecticola TaxID=2709158 RepID=A0A6A0BA19_9LACT|nr:hypothetical protein Hs20B_16990 [Lactococcus insecticola]